MTLLLSPPAEVRVITDTGGRPIELQAGPLSGRLEPLLGWVVEQDWWEAPVARRYWKALLADRLIVELYREDGPGGSWFLERVYD